MPVNFSEPLSMLQRLTEDYEYAYVLDKVSALEREVLDGLSRSQTLSKCLICISGSNM